MERRYRWVILGAGTFAQSTFSAVSVGLPALAPALRAHYRLTLGETGVVLGAVGMGMLLTLLPWGLLADRIGERAVMSVGLAAAGGALVATSETQSYPALVGLLALSGALGASVNAASGRAVMGWFAARERGLALGIHPNSAYEATDEGLAAVNKKKRCERVIIASCPSSNGTPFVAISTPGDIKARARDAGEDEVERE